jgi:hypothetical protein
MKISFRIKVRLLLCLSLLLIFILSGCRQNTEIDSSFITDLPCSAPCWYGLKLDVSSKADVLATLNQLSFVDKKSIHEYGSRWRSDDQAIAIYYDCISLHGNCGSFTMSGDRLKRIWMHINYPLTFKQAVDKLGEPEYIEYGVCQPEYCRVNLDWPDQNIFVVSSKKGMMLCNEIQPGKKTISPEAQITDIFYAIVEESPKQDVGSCLQLMPWPGFREP